MILYGKLANTDSAILENLLHTNGLLLKDYANGIDNSDILSSTKNETKSIGNSRTTVTDLTTIEEIENMLLSVISISAKRLRDQNMKAKTITVNLKNSNFQTYSCSHSLMTPINTTNEIYKVAIMILKKCYRQDNIRLVGISLSNLTSENFVQTNIFDKYNEKEVLLDKTIDKINSKFNNKNIITRGSLL